MAHVNEDIIDKKNEDKILYGIADRAPWFLSVLSGFQHFLAIVGGTIPIPYLLFFYYCIGSDNPARSEIAAAMFFVNGITTILQSAVGSRLPIMQGPSLTYLIPVIVLFQSPSMKCPNLNETESIINITLNTTKNHIWQERISLVQGSIMLASVFEIILGLTGLVGYLLPYISPLTLFPITTLLGFSVIEETFDYCSGNWPIAILTIFLLIIVCEPMTNIRLPMFFYSKIKGCYRSESLPIFQLFPVLIVTLFVWMLCIILTYCNVFSDHNKARTDLNIRVIREAEWFRIPYPMQWGSPSLNVGCVIGMIGSVLILIVEAVGNYYTCARICNAPPFPVHALNRGILIEGIGTFLDGLIGIGNGSVSFTDNIAIIGLTKMASRRIMYVAGVMMMLIGVFTKLTAIFMVIPEPILGGIFLIIFCSICSIGLGYLQYVDMNSRRNILVIGLPLYCGLALPIWFKNHPDTFQTGYNILDGVLLVIFRTNVFVGGIMGVLMDNMLPGTPEERGLINWNKNMKSSDLEDCTEYDLPFQNFRLKKNGCLKKIPFCP